MKALIALITLLIPLSSSAATGGEKLVERAEAVADARPDSALALCRQALPQLRRGSEAHRHALHCMGNAWFSLGDNASAADCFRQAVGEAEAARDTAVLAAALRDWGVVLRVGEKPDSALLLYRRSLDLYSKQKDADGEAHLLTSIAVLYANTGRMREAVPFARKAYAMAKRGGDMETVMYAGGTLGIILYKSGAKAEGLATERDIVATAERRCQPRYMLKAYASLIDMHLAEGRQDSALYYIRCGQRLMPQVPAGSVEALGFMEEEHVVLAQLGRHRESLDIQLRIAAMRGAGTFMPMDKLYLRMARNYTALHKPDSAAAAYERAFALADSLRSADIDQQLSEFDVRYRTAQQDLQIARLEADAQRGRTTLAIVLAAIVAAAAALALWLGARRRRERIGRLRARLDGIEAERGRLAKELHDGVCNDILGIGLLIQAKAADRDEAVAELRRVYDDVRQISHELTPPRFAGATLADMLADMAAKSHGVVELHTPDGDTTAAIKADTALQLYRMVQEITGNMRRHARATHIDITLSAPATINIVSDVPAAPTGSKHSGKDSGNGHGDGIGLANLQARATAIGAAFTRDDGRSATIILH